MANIFPFGSTGGPGYSDPGSTFQQIYSAGAFSGPITITGVSFASANGEGGSGGTFVGAVTISLGTSAQTAANVSDTYADNQGSDLTNVYTGIVTESLTESDVFDLSFNFSAPFTYNPANGDLLFQVTTGAIAYSGTDLYFDADTNSDVSEVFNSSPSSSGSAWPGYGLFTEFTYTAQSPTTTPEPSSLPLVVAVLLPAAYLFRSKLLSR